MTQNKKIIDIDNLTEALNKLNHFLRDYPILEKKLILQEFSKFIEMFEKNKEDKIRMKIMEDGN
jgi:hypothetical protein